MNGFFSERIAFTFGFTYGFTSKLKVIGLSKISRKPTKSYRFDDSLYGEFKQICKLNNVEITTVFERFMIGCVEAGRLVFPEKTDYNAEARVMVDWLGKGQFFYRGENGDELSVQARLLWLLPKVSDVALKGEVEEALKGAVRRPVL